MPTLHDVIGETGIFTDGNWILSENMDANGKYGVIQLKHVGVGEFLGRKEFNFISEKTFKSLDCTEVLPGDVLISRMADPIGRACIVPELPFPCITVVDVTIVRIDKNIADAHFVMNFCNSDTMRNQINRAVRGTTRERITRTELGQLTIPLPSLPEQQRIAAILQKADRLRRLRRYARQISDGYLQSVFLEMFGDPKKNPKEYGLVKLGDLMSFMTSGSRGWAEHYCDKGAIFLRVQNVGANRLLLDDVAYVQPPDSAESRRTRVKSGDLLISATADIGRTGVIPDNFPVAFINQHLFLIRLKYFNPVFVAGYFSTPSGKAQILQSDSEGVKSGLNFDDAKGLTIFNVPLEEQEHFASVFQRYEHLRNQQSESIRQAENLFQSLLKKAFQGEL